MKQLPLKLKPGDTVGLVSPSRELPESYRDRFNTAVLELGSKLGLQVKVGKHVWSQHYYSAGTAEERLEDFHSFIKDPSIKAIIFTVGGKSANQMLPLIDWDLIQANLKIIAGISDAATLLNPISQKCNLVTYYGIEFIKVWGRGVSDFELDSVKQQWFKESSSFVVKQNPNWQIVDGIQPERTPMHQVWREGQATGELVGGSLGIITNLGGSPYDIDYQNKILFLEAYALTPINYHHLLQTLKNRGVFNKISGLIIGFNYNYHEQDEFRYRSEKDIVLEVTKEFNFPIYYNPDIGHHVRNHLLPIGGVVEMKDGEVWVI